MPGGPHNNWMKLTKPALVTVREQNGTGSSRIVFHVAVLVTPALLGFFIHAPLEVRLRYFTLSEFLLCCSGSLAWSAAVALVAWSFLRPSPPYPALPTSVALVGFTGLVLAEWWMALLNQRLGCVLF